MKVTRHIPGQADILMEVIWRLSSRGAIVDIGAGSGLAARRFFEAGWDVTATGFDPTAYTGDDALPEGIQFFEDVDITDMNCFEDGQFDAVWCAHVIEHVLDTGRALAEIRRILKPDGQLFIAVPPFKHQIVGGHVSNGWNLGNLMYVLAVCGFDLSDGAFVRHGYNVFASVRRGKGPLSRDQLRFANGDLEILTEAGRFPKGFDAKQGFNGQLDAVNWEWSAPPKEISVSRAQLTDPPPIPKMRIGFFVPWITKGRGGTENVGRLMANSMASLGHEVVIFTFDDEKSDSLWELDPLITLVHLAEADTEPNHQQMLIEVARFNVDLLVGLHMNRGFLRYVRCAGKLGKPLVLSEHIDPRFPEWMGTNSPRERAIAFAGATLIHLLTPAFCDTVPTELRDRVRVIPNTVPDPTALSDPGASVGEKRLLTVARLVPRKNISQLIEAFATIAPALPDWTLCIVGGGAQLPQLRNSAKALGLAGRVEFVGEVSDTYKYYSSAHLFTLPSYFEGFPMSTLEACAHGLPVVAYSTCNGVNEQVVHGESGLLSTSGASSDSLAEDLRTLMSDASQRKQMGAAALERFEQLYQHDVVAEQWEQLFWEAIEQGPAVKRPNCIDALSSQVTEFVFGADPARISAPT